MPTHERWTAPQTGRSIGPRLVAMFDVLGFRNMVMSKPVHLLLGDYEELLWTAELTANLTELSTAQPGTLGLTKWRVPHAVFSDTLLFWCDDDDDAVWAFLKICGGIAAEALRRKMPLRGGIAFGEAIMDKEAGTYLGKPIVYAYETEAAQEWVGIGLHGSCFLSPQMGSFIRSHEDIVAWDVPTKDGRSVGHALLWHHQLIDAADRLEALCAAAPAAAQPKYVNALRFVRSHPAPASCP